MFQVRLMSFLDSHTANKKQAHKRNRWAERSSERIISLFYFFSPPTLTVTFHMFIKIITAGRENPQAVAASPLEVFHF